MSVFTIFSLLGGIALFLFGMQIMSDGLEKAAGSKMRQILEVFTKNRLVGVIVGLVVTAVIQSSSATTATVVSFVNAGLMSLTQSVGVIFGANIGTTITGQLVAFKFEAIAPLIVAAGLISYMFIKNNTVKKVGYIILGFGVLFIGMGIMKDAMQEMAESPIISDALTTITNPFILLLIGLVITAVIQSSSAMVGILIGLASSGLLPLSSCFFVILGSDIGACVTAVIASLNSNREAKRSALIHVLFNVVVSAIIFILLCCFEAPIEQFILSISPGDSESAIASRAVAMSITVFKVFGVLIMFPCGNLLVKLTKVIIPIKPEESRDAEEGKLQFINPKLSNINGSAALQSMSKEIERVGDMTFLNLQRAMDALLTKDLKNGPQIAHTEENIDTLTKEMQEYMIKITQMPIADADEHKVSGYFHTIIDLERIGDHAENIYEVAEQCVDQKIEFSEIAIKELEEMYGMVLENLIGAMSIFTTEDYSKLNEVLAREEEIDKMEKKLQADHIERMSKGECSPKSGIYSDLLSNLERAGDHADNIAIAIIPDNRLSELTGKNRIEL